MTTAATPHPLQALHQLLLEEREYAKTLDMRELGRVQEEKQRLLAVLAPLHDLDDNLKELAKTIRKENRRNAFLLWTGLNVVRETMGFFHQQTARPVYGRQGVASRPAEGGRLLNGKV